MFVLYVPLSGLCTSKSQRLSRVCFGCELTPACDNPLSPTPLTVMLHRIQYIRRFVLRRRTAAVAGSETHITALRMDPI